MNFLSYAAIAFLALATLGGAVKAIRWDAVEDHKREIAAATADLQRREAIKAAENAAQSEHEALAVEAADAERERRLAALIVTIAELEGKNAKCGFISRDTVRALNASR